MNNLRKFLLIIFSLIAFGTTVQSQNWHEAYDSHSLTNWLLEASDPHIYIRITNDITLEAYLQIGENVAQTVTIDLDGHTLQRTGLTGPDANGHVIEVFNNGVLTLTSSQPGGKITGGWANNGGGICNYGSLTIGDNVTITGCKANEGGGIKNNAGATLTINGGCITGNIATGNGCGIWSNGTLNMQGNVTVTGNTREDGVPQNVFLKSGKMITMTGSFTNGTQVAVFLEAGSGKFTSGYGTHNSGTEPNTYFTADIINQSVTLSEGEAMLSSLEGTVYYIEREWDSNAKKVKATQKTVTEFQVMNDNITTLANNTWYVVNSNVAPKGYLKHFSDAVKVEGTAHLIICDGAKLTAAIDLEVGSTLHIYAQSFGSGMIDADGGIGPGRRGSMGDLFIHGGIIDATSDDNDAGIGTCYTSYIIPDYSTIDGGNVTIYDGTITATGGDYGAGIGGGDCRNFEYYEQHIRIYGGTVVANGGIKAAGIGTGAGLETEEHENGYLIEIFGGNVEAHGGKYGAGIGSGQGISAGTLKVYGGIVKAYGGEDGAGIGCGERTTATTSTINGGKVFVNGGKVYAYGGKYGAGIGGGQDGNGATVEVNDGYVFADGGTDAAGIGSGEKYMPGTPNGGKLTVNGGHVFADGTGWGAGIGGGEDSDGAIVTINGGTVEAWAGDDAGNKNGSAIGSEDGDGHYGTLTLGPGMMVHAGDDPSHASLFDAPYRVPACRWRKYARVEPCNHQGATYTINGTNADGTHTLNCSHCLSNKTERHTFDGEICTVCHVHGETCTVDVYLPEKGEGNTYSYGTNPKFTHTLVKGSKFELPSASLKHLPKGVRFVGWREGDPITLGLNSPEVGVDEETIPAGTSYTVTQDTSFTGRYKRFPIFITTGNWNEPGNWYGNEVPTAGSDVIIDTTITVTIPNGYTADAGDVTIGLGGSLVIEEGGQLIHSNERVPAMVRKNITAYTVASGAGMSDGWNFITLPVYAGYTPDATMLSNTYDLYRLNPKTMRWENFKAHDDFTTLDIGFGYLYANNTDVRLEFTGPLLPYNKRVADHNNAVIVDAGWNLVGNPFVCNAYANRPFYKMNAAHTGIEAVEEYWNTENYIAPCTGFVVHADADGAVWLTHTPPEAPAGSNHGSLQIVLSQAVEPVDPSLRGGTTKQSSTIDNAIVSFTEGSTLPKFRFGDNAEIYLTQNGEDYAITFSEGQGEMPLNFKAKENGQYTISVNPEGVEMGYLHLIDNMNGNDVDLLQTPNYSFETKTTDYESRFRLVFVCGDANDDNDGDNAFAFFSNGNIIVNGEGTLQVIDVTGRVILSGDAKHCVSTTGMTAGVYVLRLINGENVRTQKIVIQ